MKQLRIGIIFILISFPLMLMFQNCGTNNPGKKSVLASLPKDCTVKPSSTETLLGISAFNPQFTGTFRKFLYEQGQTPATPIPQGTRLSLKMFERQECGNELYTEYVLQEQMTIADIEEMLLQMNCVEGGHVAKPVKLSFIPIDPLFPSQRHLNAQNINAPEGWDIFYNAANGITKDVLLGVVDCGVDNHVDLVQAPGSQNAVCNHATHVAGLAAATMTVASRTGEGGVGVMGQHAQILSANAFARDPQAPTDRDAANAIDFAVNSGAQVINISLASNAFSQVMLDSVARAVAMGVTVVVAAGNDGKSLADRNNTPSGSVFVSPGSFVSELPGQMLSVGSIDASLQTKSFFSNFHPLYVNIAAPGSDGAVNSTTPGSKIISTIPPNSYGGLQGTSMASPIVAGAAALVVGLATSRGYPTPPPRQVVDLIHSSGKIVRSLDGFVLDSKALDLKALGIAANAAFPVGGAPIVIANTPSKICP